MVAGIPASQYSHLKYFPSVDAYNDYYDIVVDICDIGVESFAVRAQTMLVDYLRTNYGDSVADWCRDFWTAARGRMCLAHSRYGGCNNNMGVEVAWRDIKHLCPASASLGRFLMARIIISVEMTRIPTSSNGTHIHIRRNDSDIYLVIRHAYSYRSK